MTTPWTPKPKTPKAKKPAPPKEPNPATNPARVWGKKARRSPYHSNTVRRVLHISKAAWEGRSAGEIADELGVGTQYVYQLASDYRIRFIPKSRSQYAFRTIIELDSLTRLEAIAAERGDDVTDLVTRAIDALSREPVLLANLIDDDESKPPQKSTAPKRKPLLDTRIEDDGDREGDGAT